MPIRAGLSKFVQKKSSSPSTKSFSLARFKNGASDSIDKWLCMPAAAESDRRVLGDPPSVGADFDATPELIGVDQAVLLGETDRDVALRTIELGLRLEHLEGCIQRSRARRIPGPLIVLLAQPNLKALATKRPSFSVPVDDEVRKTGAVACVKEPGRRCDIQEDIRDTSTDFVG
jgi:hypothetical protein